MAVYYVASKLSIIACSTSCIALRRRSKCANNSGKLPADEDTKNWQSKELINMGFSSSVNTICGTTKHLPDSLCQTGTEIVKIDNKIQKEENQRVITVRSDGIVLDSYGAFINGPLESFIDLLMPQHQNFMDIDHNFIFSFLLSSRLFIPPHELLEKLVEPEPENDESLDRLVVLMREWTRWFPYDFRGEEIMSLMKQIVLRCSSNKQLGDAMSDLLSALLIKLDELCRHENEMKAYKRPLTEKPIKEWPNSSKLAQLLCHVDRKFAKHIGPEEFVQCSTNLIKDETGYDVPSPHPLLQATTCNITSSAASSSSASTNVDTMYKKKTCNLENYFEWSNRLRLLVANEILQCTDECDRSQKIELWSSVAQHCLLVGNYNSATSILEPICRLQAMWKKILSATNRQQLDCLVNHIENSQNLNLWNKQTEKSSSGNQLTKKPRRILNSSPPRDLTDSSSSIIRTQPASPPTLPSTTTRGNKGGSKLEWVAQPVFVDIVKLALKAREDCCTRLPNGCIDFVAFNKLSAIVSAFTMHMSNVPINPMNYDAMEEEEYNSIVNHIFTHPLTPENELYIEFARNATKMESYYDVP